MRRTTVQWAALVFGIVFLLVGVLGLLEPGGTGMEADVETAPKLLGLFPVNLLHNIVHILFGLWGLAASRTWSAAKGYATAAGAIYAVLAVLGLVAPDGFGLVPLGGADVWLHAVLAAALLAVGLTARAPAATS